MHNIEEQVLLALKRIKEACEEKRVKPGIIDNLDGTIFLAQKILKSNEPKTIGFFGAQKRGKSSLINQLLGCDLLPVAPIPMSSVAIELHKDSALKDGDFSIDVIDGNGSFENCVVNLEQAKLMLREFGSHKGSAGDDVETIKVTSNFPESSILENGGVLVDTPGAEIAFAEADSHNKVDAERAIKILASMHIVIFVERADLMQGRNSVLFFKKELKPLRPLTVVNFKDKLVLDAARANTSNSGMIEMSKQNMVREIMLKTFGVTPNRILCVSCKEAADARKISDNINKEQLECSNILKLEKLILNELENLSPRTGLMTCLKELSKILEQFDDDTARDVITRAKTPFHVILKENTNERINKAIKEINEKFS